MSIEAMKQALEALEIGLEYAESELYENRRRYEGYMHLAPDDQTNVNQIKEAITALRQAIAEAEKQEPCYCDANGIGEPGVSCGDCPIRDYKKPPAEKQEPVDSDGSPCPEFWDWLPKAYRDGDIGDAPRFTKYNMEVAFLAGKQSTHPPKREWVGLTDEELKPLCDENHIIYGAYTVDFIQSIEAKLKAKNGFPQEEKNT